MRHRYRCPLRWADQDLQGHVNNVALADYLQEARVDMMRTESLTSRAAGLGEGMVVVRHEISYLAPIAFSFRPVTIEAWVSRIRAASVTLDYIVYDDIDGERTDYARASTVLAPYVFGSEIPRRLTAQERAGFERFLESAPDRHHPSRAGMARAGATHYPARVRFSDIDVYGHVNNVRYLEYYQEARVALLDSLRRGLPVSEAPVGLAVARVDVDYRVPLVFRPSPYDVWSRVAAVGRTSYTVEAEITDGDVVASRSRAVVVCFDPGSGRPIEPPESLRAALSAAVARG